MTRIDSHIPIFFSSPRLSEELYQISYSSIYYNLVVE